MKKKWMRLFTTLIVILVAVQVGIYAKNVNAVNLNKKLGKSFMYNNKNSEVNKLMISFDEESLKKDSDSGKRIMILKKY